MFESMSQKKISTKFFDSKIMSRLAKTKVDKEEFYGAKKQ